VFGDHAPAVIINSTSIANCYVKDFILYLTNDKKPSKIVHLHDLNNNLTNNLDLNNLFLEWFNGYSMKSCYRIKVVGTELFYKSYNFKNFKNRSFRYPIFSEHDPKIFYTKRYAQDIIKEFNKEGSMSKIKLEVV